MRRNLKEVVIRDDLKRCSITTVRMRSGRDVMKQTSKYVEQVLWSA